MKNLLILLAFLSAAMIGGAQNSIFPDVPYTNLNFMDVRGENIFALGSCDYAMYSIDGGQEWVYLTIPDETFRDVKIIATDEGDLALLMADAGLWSWNFTTEEMSTVDISEINQFGNLKAIEILDDKIYLVAVGRIHYATAPDFAWEMLTDVLYPEDYSINTSAINSNALYIASTDGHLFEAVLTGDSYEQIHKFEKRVSALYMFDSGTGYATVQSTSGPVKTTNSGADWAVLNNFAENAKVYAYDENVVLTVNTNRFYVSTDGGDEVTYVPLQEDANVSLIHDASFTDDGDLYFCGRSSTVLKSTNSGLSYSNLNEYNRSDLYQITMEETGRGLAVGTDAVFYTSDEGISWNSFDTEELGVDPPYVSTGAILADDTYLIGYDGGHALIKDGALLSDGGINLQALYNDAENGVLLGITQIGGNYVIVKSTDNSTTWENKYFADDYINKIKSTADGKLYCSIESAYIVSENEGEDWEKIDLPVEGYITDMTMLDDGTSLFAIAGKLYESDDSGVTLTEIASGNAINNIHFFAPDHFIYTQISSTITFLREKHPDNPSIATITNFCGEVRGADLQGDLLWLSFRGGHINNYDFSPDMPDAVRQPSVQPLSIYPNPISTESTLHFSTTSNTTHLQIFNALGGLVLDATDFTGSNLLIDQDRFAPGIYILRQEVDGKLYQSKLLVTQ